MYENYLLNAAAAATVLSADEAFTGTAVSPEQVQKAIEAKRNDAKYYRPLTVDIAELGESWISEIHAGNVLEDLFSELTRPNPVIYDKIKHSVALTDWLIVENLQEIASLLECVLNQANSNASE
jgi:hypothetical protein